MTNTGSPQRWQVSVGLGSCGIAAGAKNLYDYLARHPIPGVTLHKTGCAGLCHREPMLEVLAPDGRRWSYADLTLDGLKRVVSEHLEGGRPVAELLLESGKHAPGVAAYLRNQQRVVLENCGRINPEVLEDYLANQGYEALRKAVTKMTPAEVVAQISESGLRGRGGAGFPTGTKWKLVAAAPGPQKYIICNGDEGDPGAFMDRSVLEGDPHRILEGMLIGAFAIGASHGFLYVRAEYPLAIERLKIALGQAKAAGFLGERIFGSPFGCDLEIREGAGAFVCGEETALIASLEGRRGMPRVRPPFPARSGLYGKPTCINNVETFANVPWIIRRGGEAFAAVGTEKSKGTKIFTLAGKVKRGGLVEVPMGLTLREVVEEIGGGSSTDKPVKAVQTGGPSGGCLPVSLFDTPIDYDELAKTGSIMGSGGMVVMDEGSCMVDTARFFLTFTKNESCGKCTFCRIGTQRMLEILDRIAAGNGTEHDLSLLEELAAAVKAASLCGLGQSAPNPVLTTLRYFKAEYEAHVTEKRCPAKVCKALIRYGIIAGKCTGCMACVRPCPSGAITGEKKKVHTLTQDLCIKCGACLEACRFDAISVE